MRLRGAAAGIGALIGCATPSSVFNCTDSGQCDGGRCEPTGYCSFPSSQCDSGWAYGELSAPMLVGTCVGTEPEATSGAITSSTTEPVGSVDATSSADGTNTSTSNSSSPPDESSDDDSDTGYDPIPPAACYDYAAFFSYCYDESYQQALERCAAYYWGYYANEACLYAYEDYLACLSTLDCGELMLGYCAEEGDQIDAACFGA